MNGDRNAKSPWKIEYKNVNFSYDGQRISFQSQFKNSIGQKIESLALLVQEKQHF